MKESLRDLSLLRQALRKMKGVHAHPHVFAGIVLVASICLLEGCKAPKQSSDSRKKAETASATIDSEAAHQLIELTESNPSTLIGTDSENYTVHGLRLGITHEQAWQLLRDSKSLLGEEDQNNPSRIYVYGRNADGSKGESLLYLVWEPGTSRLSLITVFQDFRERLAPNFRRLLTFEAIDSDSEFKKAFIGCPNRSELTLDIPQANLKHVTYYYEEIGLAVVDKHSSDGDEVVFALREERFQT